jgi:hypothetical protein
MEPTQNNEKTYRTVPSPDIVQGRDAASGSRGVRLITRVDVVV